MLRASSSNRIYPWRLWDESSLTVGLLCAGYLIVALLLLYRWDEARPSNPFLLILGCIYGAVALDRFAGGSARLMKGIRSHARITGWYWPWRRTLQVTGMLVLLTAGVVTINLLLRQLRTPAEVLALGGVTYSLVLVGLRVISFHEFDMILYRRRRFLGGRTLNAPIECTGLLITLAATFMMAGS